MKIGAVILCGGQSRRMGQSKALLPFGPERMLQRVVRLLDPVADRRVVVAAPDQELPALPDDVSIVRDRQGGRGPLEGLRAGLTALGDQIDAAYATGCDVPLLQIAFVQSLIERLADYEVVVPIDGTFHHPLAAVYRTSVVPHLETLLAQNRLRPVYLYDTVPTCRVPVDDLRSVDPDLLTLANLNRPEDYVSALHRAGLEVPADFFLRENSRETGENPAESGFFPAPGASEISPGA